jgi:uncharacterized protein (DUF488 family)
MIGRGRADSRRSMMADREQQIFTIGHSNHPIEAFLALLQRHVVEAVVDVRSQPYSRHNPQFGRDQIQTELKQAGLSYVYLGRELGGRPEGEEFYDAAGRVLYERVADSARFGEGLARLVDGLGRYRVAVMCSEEDPTSCHRRLLVGWALRRRGVAIRHIRGDGRLESEEDLARQGAGDEPQLSLFDELGEVGWRSTRSVSPRSRPPPSSAP